MISIFLDLSKLETMCYILIIILITKLGQYVYLFSAQYFTMYQLNIFIILSSN